jgi:hypothetical protein
MSPSRASVIPGFSRSLHPEPRQVQNPNRPGASRRRPCETYCSSPRSSAALHWFRILPPCMQKASKLGKTRCSAQEDINPVHSPSAVIKHHHPTIRHTTSGCYCIRTLRNQTKHSSWARRNLRYHILWRRIRRHQCRRCFAACVPFCMPHPMSHIQKMDRR